MFDRHRRGAHEFAAGRGSNTRTRLTGSPAFFENIIMDRIHAPQRRASNVGTWHADPESSFHAHYQLECVDRIEPQAVRTEKREIVGDLVGCGLQHQIFHQHLFNASAQIGFGHK